MNFNSQIFTCFYFDGRYTVRATSSRKKEKYNVFRPIQAQ